MGKKNKDDMVFLAKSELMISQATKTNKTVQKVVKHELDETDDEAIMTKKKKGKKNKKSKSLIFTKDKFAELVNKKISYYSARDNISEMIEYNARQIRDTIAERSGNKSLKRVEQSYLNNNDNDEDSSDTESDESNSENGTAATSSGSDTTSENESDEDKHRGGCYNVIDCKVNDFVVKTNKNNQRKYRIRYSNKDNFGNIGKDNELTTKNKTIQVVVGNKSVDAVV